MLTINGKTLIYTDIHFGLKNDSVSRLNICVNVTDEITKYVKEHDIDNVIFMGDYIHTRNVVSVNTLNVAYKCLEKLAKNVNFYFILGNHDIFYKNNSSVSSANIFKDIKNIHLISEATECYINGKKSLFAPWFSDLSLYNKSTYDLAFGHFDVNPNFLIASYIEDNINKNLTSNKIKELINNDEFLRDSGLDDLDFENENKIDTFIAHTKSSELIGSWIEVVKKHGTIFSGHIHQHREMYVKERKFIFVGSPYQQNRGEMDSVDGFYVLDEDNKDEFVEITNTPKHIDLRLSEITKNIDAYDFSVIKGNIIHKIYDVEVDRVMDAKISQKIIDNKPYEELTPDYEISQYNINDGLVNESISSIRKSKLEYLHNYIGKMGNELMNENNVEKDKLFKFMTEYYERATEGM